MSAIPVTVPIRAAIVNFTFVVSETIKVKVNFAQKDGQKIDFSGGTLEFIVTKGGKTVLKLSSVNNKVITNLDDCNCFIEQTNHSPVILKPDTYVYYINFKTDKVRTYMTGTLTIKE